MGEAGNNYDIIITDEEMETITLDYLSTFDGVGWCQDELPNEYVPSRCDAVPYILELSYLTDYSIELSYRDIRRWDMDNCDILDDAIKPLSLKEKLRKFVNEL